MIFWLSCPISMSQCQRQSCLVTDRHLPPSHYVSIGDAEISQALSKYELASFPLAHKKWPNMLFYQSSPQNSLVTDRHPSPSPYMSIGDARIFKAFSKYELVRFPFAHNTKIILYFQRCFPTREWSRLVKCKLIRL